MPDDTICHELYKMAEPICQIRPWDEIRHCLCATVVVDALPCGVNHDRLHRRFLPVADLLQTCCLVADVTDPAHS